jgi:hypothetical protein
MHYKYTHPNNENINIHENYDVEYWAKQLKIRPAILREVIINAGPSVNAVKKYLGT